MLFFTTFSHAEIASSFSKAKSIMYKKVYKNQGKTFYTNCAWSKKKVNLETCNLQDSFPKKDMKRAKRTEAEHVIPSSWMYKKNGKFRKCVIEAKALGENKRKYCQKIDLDFRDAHNDLMNLRPAVGALNAYRSNKPFSDILSGKNQSNYHGRNKTFKVSSRVVIPDKTIRGDIARIGFYMSEKYGVSYSKRQLILFKSWDMEDPIDKEEQKLIRMIVAVQGM